MSDVKSFIVPPSTYNLGNFPQSVDPWVPGSHFGGVLYCTTFNVETEVYGTSSSDMRYRHTKPCDGEHDFVSWSMEFLDPNAGCSRCLWLRKELEPAAGAYWKCECGAEAVGSDRHASYCPKFRR